MFVPQQMHGLEFHCLDILGNMFLYNPLLSDPSSLKDVELEEKILELSKKYHIAARFGQGQVCEQIVTALNYYKDEQLKRAQTMLTKTVKNTDKDLGELIKVS